MGAPEGGKDGGGIANLVMLGAIAIIFYFFMIRPQSKKQKEQKKFREDIKNGDKIITIGGIHGKIVESKDTTVVIETEGGQKMKIEKTAISLEYTSGKGTSDLGSTK
jgi:preprotein translocase subunit YajC